MFDKKKKLQKDKNPTGDGGVGARTDEEAGVKADKKAYEKTGGEAELRAKIEKLQKDVEAANKKADELTEAAKRALADLANFRKRVEEDKKNFVAYANTGLILELLPVLDNFNRAFMQTPEEIRTTDWFRGALQIEQQLTGVLKKQGVSEMPSSIGQILDPEKHEALGTGPGKKDMVIEEFEKGYMFGKKVIRPAKVKVGDGSENLKS